MLQHFDTSGLEAAPTYFKYYIAAIAPLQERVKYCDNKLSEAQGHFVRFRWLFSKLLAGNQIIFPSLLKFLFQLLY